MRRRFHRWTASSRRPSAPPPGPVVTRRGLLLLWTGTVASGGLLVGLARWGLGDPSTWTGAAPAPTGTATARPFPTGTPRPFPTAGASPASTAVPTAAAPTATAAPAATATAAPAAGATATAGASPTAPAAPAAPEPRDLVDPVANRLPRWRGFNLQEMFNVDWGFRKYEERDFAWIAELGFNFVRLPLDYRAWAPRDWMQLDQGVLGWIDDALLWAERYGIHVCLNFHRAPGYTVTQPPEAKSLWTDEEAQRACTTHWAHFAKRYAGHPNKRLSFNLFNEPPKIEPQVHRAVVGRVLEAIRKEDGKRLVICDGSDWGLAPPAELAGLGIAAATRGYEPFGLTHYRAEWVPNSEKMATPAYPWRDGGTMWGRDTLRQQRVDPWKALEGRGIGVMVGEFGAYNRTPHRVVLDWMRDSLQLWRDAGWGWAMWNFRGPFGILDSGRADVSYETWRGHRLDRAMLEVLRQY
ncbi:MAG TPA: cellulase family glycosylhydrolase [Chloroflexota bacterium]|nr:cellulase family glycosylhydrolase [Chloroflexota bacterium]